MVLKKSLFITASFLSLFLVTKANYNQNAVTKNKNPYLELAVLNTQMASLFTQQGFVTTSTRSIEDAVTKPQIPTPTGLMFGQWKDSLKKENNNTQPHYSFFSLLNSTFNNKNHIKFMQDLLLGLKRIYFGKNHN